jgi:zinc protease
MRLKCAWPWLAALTLATLPAGAAAQADGAAGEIPFESYRLDNGLHVILSQDRTAPVVTVNLWYDVGSRHERRGRTGFAHLFEHLMFEGSENVARGDHSLLVRRAGGVDNASQTEDRTNYFATLPSNRLNLGLWLEADRMRALEVTQESLNTQREVVKEERRMRIDNSPYGTTLLAALYEASYDPATCFAYAHTPIGEFEDLDAATLEDVQFFFETYYVPNNATLTVVGDFDREQVRSLIEEYFGSIPVGDRSVEAPPCTEPFSHLPLRRVIEDRNATLPALYLAHGGVAAGHADSHALSVMASILGSGEASRLNQRLVRQEQAALAAQAQATTRLGPGLVLVLAIPNQGVAVERLEGLIQEEVERLANEGVTAEELERAKSRYRASTFRGRQTTLGRAEALQWYNHFHGDPAAHRADMARYEAVTGEDVQRVARQYLAARNRATLVTQPATAQEEE